MASDAPAVPVPVPAVVPAPVAVAVPTPAQAAPPPKRRGSYNCGRCGQPKKGHVCSVPGPAPAPAAAEAGAGGDKAGEPQPQPQPQLPPPQQQAKPRRALQFDDPAASASASPSTPAPPAARPFVVMDAVPLAVASPPAPSRRPPAQPPVRNKATVVDVDSEEDGGGGAGEDDEDDDLPWVELVGGRRWPGEVLVEVLRRLPPRAVAAAAGVSRGWRHYVTRVWEATLEVRLSTAQIGPVAAIMERCTALASLVLHMKRDFDATMLGCILLPCPNLQSLDISMANNTANRITGDELSRFVSEKRSLSFLKLEGCSSLGFLNISSSSLSSLWLSGLCSLTKAVMNCPNLNELSLVFPDQNNDSTNLVALMDSLGRTCPNLRNMHVSSIRLCNEVVFALASANLRGLRMLSLVSLVLGSTIKDEAVTSIVRSYASLELLNLSGSCITDDGLEMISKAYPNTLTHLSLALCPKITSSGIQGAAARLPLLCLMDCGNSICDKPQLQAGRTSFGELTGGIKLCYKLPIQTSDQKLIIKHGNLKKLSLWGCSAIDALYVNCPELVDLNLNSCTNIHPERLRIMCPKLKDVHVNGCREMLIGAIRNQLLNEFAAMEPRLPCKRLADGFKRVHVPQFMIHQLEEQENCGRPRKSQCTVHR